MGRNVDQLKNEARRAEQREDWSRAIDLYRQAIRISEETGDISLDLSLYNRVGDLHRRQGDTGRAIECYQKALDRYTEQGLHTGAIALCNKMLRIDAGRIEVYGELGRLYAATGLVAEARKNFQEYAARLEERGDEEARRDALLELARLTDDQALLLRVAEEAREAGRAETALEALRDVHRLRLELGTDVEPVRERIRAIEPSAAFREAPAEEDVDEGAATPSYAVGDADDEETGEPEMDIRELLLDLHDELDDFAPEPADVDDETTADERRDAASEETVARSAVPSGPSTTDVAGDPAGDESGFVVLGDRIRSRLGDDAGEGGEHGEGAADFDFDSMLAGMRAGAAGTSGRADPEAHVELGVALRQMGLVEEAIREFQAAVRVDDPPLRAFELLGECFVELGMCSVASKVLTRALRVPGHREHELLGVLYQLGVAHQELGDLDRAMECYERVFSVDIDFRDVADRMEACAR